MASNAKQTGPTLVKVRIPERYGTFHSNRGDKPDVQYKGGEVAEVTEREAEVYELEVLQVPAPTTSTSTETTGDAAARGTARRT